MVRVEESGDMTGPQQAIRELEGQTRSMQPLEGVRHEEYLMFLRYISGMVDLSGEGRRQGLDGET